MDKKPKGLRERKRKEREERILQAAEKLFGTRGFDEATIAAIAEAADVGIGTVYNYYASKEILLIAALKARLMMTAPDLFHEPGTPEGDNILYLMEPALGFMGLVDLYSKELWFQFMAAIYGARHSLNSPVFELDWMLMENTMKRVMILQQTGFIRPDVDPEQSAMVLFASVFMRFQMYVMEPEMNVDTLKNLLIQDARLVLVGIKGREEKDTI